MPDGVMVEKTVTRAGIYSHAMAQKRMNQWVLLSIHSSEALAENSKRKLEACLSEEWGCEGFKGFEAIEVVSLQQKASQ